MKLSVAVTVAAFALPALIAAQSAAPPAFKDNKPVVTYTATFDSAGNKITFGTVTQYPPCPVTMQAKQGSGAGLVAVRRQPGQPDDAPSMLDNKPGQHIHLILEKMPGGSLADVEQVVKATVTARGLSARGRMDRTPAALGSTPSDLHRTFGVTFSNPGDGTLDADLVLPGFTSVRSIRIEKLELKDGSTWSLDSMQGCIVVPDPLMLVASQFGYQPAR